MKNRVHTWTLALLFQILHSTGLEFADEMKEARDLEQVIEVHARYVRTIHERCLLHKKLSFLKDAVTKVLNLTLAFAMRWDQGIHNIRSVRARQLTCCSVRVCLGFGGVDVWSALFSTLYTFHIALVETPTHVLTHVHMYAGTLI